MLIPDVMAAKNNKKKNNKPTNIGQGSFEKSSGKDIKTKVAPAVGVTPKEKTIGNIITPAMTAISVSQAIKV